MCALYGSSRDISLFRNISRELMHNIIEQEIGYYKVQLDVTETNIYGESQEKSYIGPVLLKCLIDKNPQQTANQEYGPDKTRDLTVRFLRDDLVPYNLVPEVGDVMLWNNDYFEVDNVIENQLVVGKDPSYAISQHLSDFGSSFSILVNGHYTRPEKLNIERVR